MYNYYRSPTTFNERRAYYAAVAENDALGFGVKNVVKVRAKRAPQNIPTNWDDIAIAPRKVLTPRQKARQDKMSLRKFIEANEL
jgi:hypothetical protein